MIGLAGKHPGILSGFPQQAEPGGRAGTLILLDEIEAQTDGTATIDFTKGITEEYDEYLFKLFGVHSVGGDLLMRVSTNGGQSFDTGANYLRAFEQYHGNNTTTTVSGAGTSMTIIEGLTTSAGRFAHAQVWMLRPWQLGDSTKMFHGHAQVRGTDTLLVGNARFAHSYVGTSPFPRINGARFLMSTNDFNGGVFRLYGVAK